MHIDRESRRFANAEEVVNVVVHSGEMAQMEPKTPPLIPLTAIPGCRWGCSEGPDMDSAAAQSAGVFGIVVLACPRGRQSYVSVSLLTEESSESPCDTLL